VGCVGSGSGPWNHESRGSRSARLSRRWASRLLVCLVDVRQGIAKQSKSRGPDPAHGSWFTRKGGPAAPSSPRGGHGSPAIAGTGGCQPSLEDLHETHSENRLLVRVDMRAEDAQRRMVPGGASPRQGEFRVRTYLQCPGGKQSPNLALNRSAFACDQPGWRSPTRFQPPAHGGLPGARRAVPSTD